MSHAAEFDEYGHKDHGHVIVSIFTLRFVLIALLILTLATSGAAFAEQIIADAFHVTIPQWINALVALFIAAVKTALVVGYFMQLKYDNPMNTIIFVFTILTVASFLGFVAIDLGKRDTVDRIKNVYQYPGGDLSTNAFLQNANTGESIVQRAKRIAKERQVELTAEIARLEQELRSPVSRTPEATRSLLAQLEKTRKRLKYEGYDPHHEHHYPERQIIQDMGFVRENTQEEKQISSTNRSRPVAGVTIPGLPGAGARRTRGRFPVAGVTIPGLPGYRAPKEAHGDGHATTGHAEPAGASTTSPGDHKATESPADPHHGDPKPDAAKPAASPH